MKFSIIVPIFNVEQYLEKCLNSLIQQTYSDYEVICVDDGSFDKSFEILNSFRNEKHVFIYRNDGNRGLSYTRNKGMSYARGEYVLFVDSDDWVCDDMLENIEKATIHKPDIVFYNMEIYNEGGWAQVHPYFNCANIYRGECSGLQRLEEFYKKNEKKIEVCRQAFKNSFLQENNLRFVPEIVHEDDLFSTQCAILATRVVDINKPVYIYRRRDNSISSCFNIERLHSIFFIYKELQRFIKKYIGNTESKYLKLYLENLKIQIVNMHNFFLDDKELLIGTAEDREQYKEMFEKEDNNYYYLNYSGRQIEVLKSYKTIDIYGAGCVAAEFMKLARNIGLNIQHIWVNSMNGNMNSINMIPVYSIYHKSRCEFNRVIIAIEKADVSSIKRELLTMGCEEVIYYQEI